MGDQASERFEKKWQMSALEFHWDAHVKQCQLEDRVRGAGGRAACWPREAAVLGCCSRSWTDGALPCSAAGQRTPAAAAARPPGALAAAAAADARPAPSTPLCARVAQQLEAESKSLPDKLQEVTAELQELTRKVGGRSAGCCELLWGAAGSCGALGPSAVAACTLRALQGLGRAQGWPADASTHTARTAAPCQNHRRWRRTARRCRRARAAR